MPIQSTAIPAHPQCEGDQWVVADINALAKLVAHVLVGRAYHAALILQGEQLDEGLITADNKAKLNAELHPTGAPKTLLAPM